MEIDDQEAAEDNAGIKNNVYEFPDLDKANLEDFNKSEENKVLKSSKTRKLNRSSQNSEECQWSSHCEPHRCRQMPRLYSTGKQSWTTNTVVRLHEHPR